MNKNRWHTVYKDDIFIRGFRCHIPNDEILGSIDSFWIEFSSSQIISWILGGENRRNKPIGGSLTPSRFSGKIYGPNLRSPGTSLVVQWLRLHTPNAGGQGSIPGQGTRSHMSQLKILHAATNIWWSQMNKQIRKFFWDLKYFEKSLQTNQHNTEVEQCWRIDTTQLLDSP